jgi:glycosyltransferase involved in cell wall biosynthesis
MSAVRILIDYRPALRERTGVGEYVHQLTRALARQWIDRADERRVGDRRATLNADQVDIFTSSWKDRPSREALAELDRVGVIDRRVPVRVLNLLWHRLERPPVEWLAGRRYDVVHSPHPLLLPSARAARVVTIHDLDFLDHPERTDAEVRRDYAALAASHARRADGVLVPSKHVGDLVARRLGVPAGCISVCPHGAPSWREPARVRPGNPDGRYILFLGTLEPRKNVEGLLDAYGRLVAEARDAPPLVLAGKTTPAADAWRGRLQAAPLAGRVELRGYVAAAAREELLAGARVLVLPSFDEGFGLPVLEAMSLGIPVVASNRGALPEVAGGAAVLVDPDDPGSIASGLLDVLQDAVLARRLGDLGRARAGLFTWARSAALTRDAYERAIDRRRTAMGETT